MDLTKCPSCGKPYFHDEGKLLTRASLPEHRLCVVCVSNFPIWADELLRMPALDEAVLIAKVRADISILQGITPRFTTPFMVLKRYKELMDLRELKELKNK